MMPDFTDGRRGIYCPKCDHGDLTLQYIAKSYPSPGGQFRIRVCSKCHSDVETLEHVVGLAPEILDISGLDRANVIALRQMVRSFRQLAALKATIAAFE